MEKGKFIIEEKFKKFLIDEGVYEAFMANVEKDKVIQLILNKGEDYLAFSLSSTLVFSNTKEGWGFWNKLATKNGEWDANF
jgi:hypothetical protein